MKVPRCLLRRSLRALIWPVLGLALGLGQIQAELLVSSFGGNRVLRYNETNGAALGVFVAAGSGGLNLPHGLAVGPDGNVYVASAGNDSVLRYNGTNGAFIDAFIPSTNGMIDYPVWLEFRPDGLLYISSQLGNAVARFNATNGAFAGLMVTNGSGGLNGPSGMTWGPDGNLYVVGRFGNHVMRYNGTNGAFLGAFVPATNGILSQPFGCHFGPDGNLYVANGNSNKVSRFDGRTGAHLGDFVAAGAGGLSLPVGLEFGPDGSFYVASLNNNKVARFNGVSGASLGDFVASGAGGLSTPNFMLFRPAQTFSTNIPGIGPVSPVVQRHFGLSFTEGPAADANGNVYFSDIHSNRIYKTDLSGLLSIFITNTYGCNGLMFDQAGRLVACQRDLQRVIAFDLVATNHIVPRAANWNGHSFNGPNDLVVDRQGGVYFSDPNYSGSPAPTQSVYYVSASSVVSQVISNLSRPNGVILSPDETRLYVVLSGESNLLRYPVMSPGAVAPPTITPIPRPGDGLTIDTLGNLYLCQPSLSNITVLAPNGAMLGTIGFPESPANCDFGGKDMKTLFVTARTSIYTCRMETTGHRFAWNPSTYADFQRKFFNSTNAPNSGRADDPDADGASNELEYLTRTHPLVPGDSWKISIQHTGPKAQIGFVQIAGRGFEVQQTSNFPGTNSWEILGVNGNPTTVSPTNTAVTIADDVDLTTNRYYRVRVFEPIH